MTTKTTNHTALPIIVRPGDYQANQAPVTIRERGGTGMYSWPTVAPAKAVPSKDLAALIGEYTDRRAAHEVGRELATSVGIRRNTADADYLAAMEQALTAGGTDYPTHPRHEIELDSERATAILRVTANRGTPAVQAIAAYVVDNRADLITAQAVAAGRTVTALAKAAAFDTKRLTRLTEQMAVLAWLQGVQPYTVSYTAGSPSVDELSSTPYSSWVDELDEFTRALEFVAAFPLGADDPDDDDDQEETG